MAIFDRQGAAARVGRDISTIYRWEERGVISFVLGRIREDDLLAADKRMREKRGRPRKSAKSANEVC